MRLLLEFWPAILAGLGVAYGAFQKWQAGKAKQETAVMEVKAKQESRRAQVLQNIQDELIESERKFNGDVEIGVENEKDNRDYFTKS